jgi:long-chain acyl-CoA synthetase
MNEKSIFELFQKVCDENPDKIAYRYNKNGAWRDVTWQRQFEICKKIAKSLMALGVKKGAKVNILSQTRLHWVQADFGALALGAVSVGIYPTNLADECAYIINHSEGVVLFVENLEQLGKIQTVRNALKRLKHIVLFDGQPNEESGAMSWQVFLQKGENSADSDFLAQTAHVNPEDLAMIVYTSGTTGVPKGAMLGHGNVLFSAWNVCECLPFQPHFETILFLPLAHVFARLTIYSSLRANLSVAFAQSMQTVAEDIKEIRPHFFASAPRIYEKIHEKITSTADDAGGLKKMLFRWALGVGHKVSAYKQNKQAIPRFLALKNKVATALVFSKIQAALGGRIVCCISGAAPLNPEIARFFHACGILILEGIGMTENSSFTNVNRIDNYKFGTVGLVGPKIEQKLADDGEMLYRGPNIMMGYYKNPEATAEAIDADGWLHTGDICEIDADGFVKVTDRKKDLIITAGGKNIAPQKIERIMRTSRYISQMVAIADQRKYVSALITLNKPDIEMWATQQGISVDGWDELVKHPKIHELIEKEVQDRNKQLASFETVKKFEILPDDFSVESGEMTPTLKLRRKNIIERNSKLIDAMYDGVAT